VTRHRLVFGLPLALVVLVGLAAAPLAGAARPLTTGFTDDVFQQSAGTRALWMSRAAGAKAGLILLYAGWGSIAPSKPKRGSDPTDPANPAYDWHGLDDSVRDANARGLSVAILVSSAPAWAEGHGAPSAYPGAWRPDATAYGRFASAIAQRYSGRFTPVGSSTLPRVRYWQAWAEPNLPEHLSPQWVRSHGRWVAASPFTYRSLLNAFYAGVKSVDRGNVVITAGTAPFGDALPGGNLTRMPPALFDRYLLCVSGATRPHPVSCPDPAHFDVLAHHPYAVGSPTAHALNPDDVSVPDMARLSLPLAVAERTGRALPRGPKRLWVTEFSYDSKPPDPQAVPMHTHARWLEQAFYEFWKQGVDTVVWYRIVDQQPVPDYGSTYQSGVYFLNGAPKLSLQAFRFPFVTELLGAGSLRAWGKAPAGGLLRIERQTGHRWVTIARIPAAAGAVFVRTLTVPGRATLRAVLGSDVSLSFP
jgi:hypothetical protein